MPKYHLRNDWFAPDGVLYKKGTRAHPTEIPEALVGKLPSTAVLATPANSIESPIPLTPNQRQRTTVVSDLIDPIARNENPAEAKPGAKPVGGDALVSRDTKVAEDPDEAQARALEARRAAGRK